MSFFINWITDTLIYLGLWKKTKVVALLGLDNSGKTTLLHCLKRDDEILQTYPSHYPAQEELTLGGFKVKILDLNGIRGPRYRIWKDYFPAIDAIIFLIDASDKERFGEAKEELEKFLTDSHLADSPILILGNKLDRPEAVSEDELKTCLGLHGLTTGKEAEVHDSSEKRPLEVFMCSIVKRLGYGDGLRWLVRQM